MNGVRRFLGGISPPVSATSSDPPSASSAGFPDRPSLDTAARTSLESGPLSAPAPPTPGLSIRKGKPPSSEPANSESGSVNGRASLNGIGSPSLGAGLTRLRLNGSMDGNYSSLSSPGAGPSRERSRTPAQTRDAMLLSLLASEAVVDAREYAVLDAEEVDELKKEYALLQPRLDAAQRTLTRETKMLAAAQNLSRLNAASSAKLPLSSGSTLAAAEARVDAAQRALWKLNESAGALSAKVLQHQAAVLGAAVRELEAAANPAAPDDGFGFSFGGTDSPLMSPGSSASGAGLGAQQRFDGPHLFAGHARAVAPRAPRQPLSAQELAALEASAAELVQVKEEMGMIVGELNRVRGELSALEDERARWEEERAGVLRGRDAWDDERAAIEEERATWDDERARMEEERREWEAQLEDERAAWDSERAALEGDRAGMADGHARLAEETARWDTERAAHEEERAHWEDERRQLLERSGDAAQDRAGWDTERAAFAAERAAWAAEKEGWARERQALEDAAHAQGESDSNVALELADERRARTEEKAAADKARAAADAERAALEAQLAVLVAEQAGWALQREKHDDAGAGFAREREAFTAEREGWAAEREEFEEARESWAAEREHMLDAHGAELDDARGEIRRLIDAHGVPLFARDNSVAAYVDALDRHLSAASAGASAEEVKEWEDKLAKEVEKSEALAAQLEAARTELTALEARIEEGVLSTPTEPNPSGPLAFATDAERIVAILQPIWAMLPSASTRAAKLGPRFRAGTTIGSPTTPRTPGVKGHPTPGSPSTSISDADVRALKGLYSPRPGGALPETPAGPGEFSVEALAARVRALITDDRALIERLLRFAQAHDMLRRNADRAQKLAQDSGAALGVYQQQVAVLEAREGEYKLAIARLEGELAEQEAVIEHLRAVETGAGEQAGTVTELGEANAALSARVLALAQEAADAVRERDELRGAGETQQMQQFTLLDELNAVQTENGKLRAQLRALGKL